MPFLACAYLYTNKGLRVPNRRFERFFISILIVVFAFFAIQTVLALEVKIFAVKGVLRYIVYATFGLMILQFDNLDIKSFFKAICLLFVFSLPLAFYQFTALGRYQGFFSHANHIAYVLVICLYFLVFHRPFGRKTNLLFTLAILLSLLLTKTSGAFLVVILMVVYNFFFSKKVSLKNKVISLVGIAALTPIFVFYSDKIVGQYNTLQYLNADFILPRVRNFRPGGYGSLVWRVIYWLKIYFNFIQEAWYNIFFGIGIDHLTKGYMPYKFMYTDPHNDFIKIGVEFGLAGLVLFLNLIRNLFFILFKNLNLILILIIPLWFDNAIVSFPFIIATLLLYVYEYKAVLSQQS